MRNPQMLNLFRLHLAHELSIENLSELTDAGSPLCDVAHALC
jgi:hypothetical protein